MSDETGARNPLDDEEEEEEEEHRHTRVESSESSERRGRREMQPLYAVRPTLRAAVQEREPELPAAAQVEPY